MDGSDVASSCVVYVVWNLVSGGRSVQLVASKAKVAPIWGTSTPRMELNGAVLMMRVVLRVVLAMEEKPEQVWLAGDSETVLACC